MMKITFIIPVLNGEKFIKQCLDSILSETTHDDEIIVIDNGSTDNTTDIVRGYSDIRLYVYPDTTVATLRNRGASLASNPILAFIDSDCILCRGWRQQVASVLDSEDIHSTGSLCEVPQNARWIEKAWFAQKPSGKRLAKYMNTGNMVVRKDIFLLLGGFNEQLITDEDCEFGERFNKEGYRMLEDPDIRVVHLGNPATLKAFYLREYWHATSVLAGGSLEILNAPTLMSMAFLLSILVSSIALVLAVFVNIKFLLFTLVLLLVPLITAIYRAMQFQIYRFIPALTLLWAIFYLARIKHMLRFGLGIQTRKP